MSYDITALKNDLTGVLHGTQLNQIFNLDGVIDRAARKLLLDVDPQETIREVAFTTPIFDNVTEYGLATDVKGIALLDIRPQVNRSGADYFNQDYSQQFNFAAQQSTNGAIASQFNIKFNTSIKTIEVTSATAPPAIIVNTASGVTINGTWVQSSVATAPTTNNVNWVAGGGAIQFNIASGGPTTVGTMLNSTQAAVDLSEQLNQSYLFLWTYLPTTQFQSVRLTWGSSATDYYTGIATTTQANTAFQTGWNQLAFPWNPTDTTVVGSPDPANITYLQVDWVTNGVYQTGVLLNNITCSGGQILNYLYYSKYLFRDFTTGAYQETVTDDSNLINLDTESYNLLFYQTAYLASQQQQGRNALQYDGKFFLDEYTAAVEKYKLRYRSQTQKPRSYYYKKPNPNPGWGGGWWWSR